MVDKQHPAAGWQPASRSPRAAWCLPAAGIWPALTLTAREREELAHRVHLTVVGWLIANAPYSEPWDRWLTSQLNCNLADWCDRHAPDLQLYNLLAEELVNQWLRQAHQCVPAERLSTLEEALDMWAEVMGDDWQNEIVEAETEPATCCYILLAQRLIDQATVQDAWEAGMAWWRANASPQLSGGPARFTRALSRN